MQTFTYKGAGIKHLHSYLAKVALTIELHDGYILGSYVRKVVIPTINGIFDEVVLSPSDIVFFFTKSESIAKAARDLSQVLRKVNCDKDNVFGLFDDYGDILAYVTFTTQMSSVGLGVRANCIGYGFNKKQYLIVASKSISSVLQDISHKRAVVESTTAAKYFEEPEQKALIYKKYIQQDWNLYTVTESGELFPIKVYYSGEPIYSVKEVKNFAALDFEFTHPTN
jgi:hypothetical protein